MPHRLQSGRVAHSGGVIGAVVCDGGVSALVPSQCRPESTAARTCRLHMPAAVGSHTPSAQPINHTESPVQTFQLNSCPESIRVDAMPIQANAFIR